SCSRTHLDQRAAFEIDAVVQPFRQEDADRQRGQQQRERKPIDMPAHEIDPRRAPDYDQRSHSGMTLGFQRRSQLTISKRVTRIAENSEVNTPMLSVTAKPLTGPEPSQKSRMPATSVVTWLSRIVPKARVKPASSDDSIVRPDRISSRMRS